MGINGKVTKVICIAGKNTIRPPYKDIIQEKIESQTTNVQKGIMHNAEIRN